MASDDEIRGKRASGNELPRVYRDADRWIRSLERLHGLYTKHVNNIERFVTEIVAEQRHREAVHPDELRRMTELIHGFTEIIRVFRRALRGDLAAEAAFHARASDIVEMAQAEPRLNEITERRLQLVDMLEDFKSARDDFEFQAGPEQIADVIRGFARVVFDEIDPLLKCPLADVERALRRVLDEPNAPARTAARFTYTLDVFRDRSNHPGPENKAVNALERLFANALRGRR